MTPAFPKRGPDAGTMDQVRPHCAAWHQTTLTVDWPTYPLQTPSGGGLAPTPDRSKTPAKGFLASGEEGLTNQGPLQKGAISHRVRPLAGPMINSAHCAAGRRITLALIRPTRRVEGSRQPAALADGAADCAAALRLSMTSRPYARSIPDQIHTPSDFFMHLRAKVSGVVEATDTERLWNPRF
jgi:hypothetical protein